MKIGDLVRFAHEKDGDPVHRVVSVMSDGMVELHDMGGYFAPHLFVPADDIGDIPPVVTLPVYSEEDLIGWADKIDSRLGPISGRAADQLAVMLRATATRMRQLRADRDEQEERLRLANTGSLSLLYDIRRELGWNDKTSLSILADGVRRVRRALQTWDTPSDMGLEELAKAVKARVVELEAMNVANKNRIEDLLEELARQSEEEDDHL